MHPLDELQKRTNDAGVRFITTELDAVASLLARIHRTPDTRERVKILKEAGMALDLASKVTATIEFPGSAEQKIPHRIRELRNQLDRWSAILPQAAATRQKAAFTPLAFRRRPRS